MQCTLGALSLQKAHKTTALSRRHAHVLDFTVWLEELAQVLLAHAGFDAAHEDRGVGWIALKVLCNGACVCVCLRRRRGSYSAQW